MASLSPATRLSSLELRIRGAGQLLELCRALPALRDLRCSCGALDQCGLGWVGLEKGGIAHAARKLTRPLSCCSLDLYWCDAEDADSEEAVSALQQLPHLTLSLGIHAYYGTEAARREYDYPDTEQYGMLELPPMSALHLTRLRLIGAVCTPPDLHQLGHLRSLKLHSVDLPLADEPWGSLTQLSKLELIDVSKLPGMCCPAHAAQNHAADVHSGLPWPLQTHSWWPPPHAWPRCTPLAPLPPGVTSWPPCALMCASPHKPERSHPQDGTP